MSTSREKQKKIDRKMGLTLVAVFVVALLIFGGGAYLFARAFTGHVRSVDEYQTMQLSADTYSSKLDAAGALQSGNTTTVRAEVDGSVANVTVKDGDKVKKGDILFTIKNDEITANVSATLEAYVNAQDDEKDASRARDAANAKLKKAEKALAKAQMALENARDDAQESRQEDPGYSLDEQPYKAAIDAAQANVESAQETLDVLEANEKKAAQNTEAAKETYRKATKKEAKLTVKARAAGTVASLDIEKGAAVSASSDKAAMKIVDMSDIVAVVEVPESQVANVVKGQQATVTCPAVSDEPISATVLRVADTPVGTKDEQSPQAGDGTQTDSAQGTSSLSDGSSNGATYNVTLSLDTVDAKLKVGMTASAQISVQDYGTVYYVPASAVGSANTGTYVEAVVDKSTVKQCGITQLGTADDGRLIIQGVSLTDGMTIRTDLSNS